MAMKLLLSSVGNPDFGQDSGRPMPGVPVRTVVVQDFAEASKLCRAYIEEHDLGGGNWNGGALSKERSLSKDDGKPFARVAYNGRIFALPEKMGAKPVYDPFPAAPAKVKYPMDEFKFEEALVEVPGYGEVVMIGAARVASCKSVPGKFVVGGVPTEFITSVFMDGTGFPVQDFELYPEGIYEKGYDSPKAVFDAIQSAVHQWHEQEADGMVLRNTLKDERQSLFVQERNIASDEARLAKAKDDAIDKRAQIDELERRIEAAAAPKMGM